MARSAGRTGFWLPASALLAAAVLAPIVALAIAAAGGSATHWSHLAQSVLPSALRDTAWLLGGVGVLAIAIVFVTGGIEFTRFAWYRTSELADLPLWLIHIAWPIAGGSWIVFLGEQFLDDLRTLLGKAQRP